MLRAQAIRHSSQISSRSGMRPGEMIAAIEAWAAKQDDVPTRADAIRRLVETGLRKK
jgi:hypothetical protein